MKNTFERWVEKDEELTNRYFSQNAQFVLKVLIISFWLMLFVFYVLHDKYLL